MSRPVRMPPGHKSTPAKPLARAALAVLAGLAFLLISVPPAWGDGGRNGGIVILPNATHVSQWGKRVRATYTFGAGHNVMLQLAPGLNNVVVASHSTRGESVVTWLSGSLLTVRGADLQALAASGSPVLWMCVVDSKQMGYQFEFRIANSGLVTVILH